MILWFSYQRPINTLADLADSQYIWAAQDPAFVFSITDTDDPVMQKVAKKFRAMDEQKLKEEAMKGEIGFIIETMTGRECGCL